jgi:hypothetical protein
MNNISNNMNNMNNTNDLYHAKYIKYKTKYLQLKGGFGLSLKTTELFFLQSFLGQKGDKWDSKAVPLDAYKLKNGTKTISPVNSKAFILTMLSYVMKNMSAMADKIINGLKAAGKNISKNDLMAKINNSDKKDATFELAKNFNYGTDDLSALCAAPYKHNVIVVVESSLGGLGGSVVKDVHVCPPNMPGAKGGASLLSSIGTVLENQLPKLFEEFLEKHGNNLVDELVKFIIAKLNV